MKAFYVDSSVIAALLLEEKNSKQIRKTLSRAKQLYSGHLIEAEIFATAKRESIELSLASSFLNPVALVFPEQSLQKEYEEIFSKGYCRGADAYHIACALYLDPEKKNLSFLTLDEKQALIARQLGFNTLHNF